MKMQKEDCNHIANQVLAITGRPRYFSSAKCTKVSGHCYRVNIYTSQSTGAITMNEIAASFFITLDDDMKVIDSEPQLKRIFQNSDNSQ